MTMRARIGGWFFRWRDVLPVHFLGLLSVCARPRRPWWLIGVPFILVGEALRLWCLCFIGPTTRTREICADRLVCEGPYAVCRHPLYLANMLKVCGILLTAGHLPFALGVLAFYVLEFWFMIPHEDAFLAKTFPEAFEAYRRSVPALLPTGLASALQHPPRFSLRSAFASETKTFGSTGAILLLCWLAPVLRRQETLPC